jgi:hypothetical protein
MRKDNEMTGELLSKSSFGGYVTAQRPLLAAIRAEVFDIAVPAP